MVTLVMTALVAAPAWAAETQPSLELADLILQGDGAPEAVALLPPKQKVELTIEGPARVTLRFVGLRERRGKKLRKPGRAMVIVDGGKKKIVRPRKRRMKGWSVADHSKWIPTRERTLALDLDAGSHVISVRVLRDARVGVGLAVELERDEPPAPAEPVPEPPPPPEPPVADVEPEVTEPHIPVDDEPQIPADEPDIVITDTPAGEPAVRLLGRAARQQIRGPHGDEPFAVATIDEGLVLEAIGPCVVVLDIHAHRSRAEPESLQPVILGVMIDEVLLQTLAVDQPASEAYTVDAPYVPSDRVTLRVPVEGGAHEIRLTLSDAAVLGMSIRPQLQTLTAVGEPGLLSATTARARDLHAQDIDEVYGAVGIGAMGAAFLPSSLTHLGWFVRGDVDLAIPVAGPRFSIALSGGYLTALEPRTFADPRAASGSARVNLTLTEVPLLAEARWSAPVPSPFGVELGVGGGALLIWSEVRALHGTRTDDMVVAAAGVAQLTLMLELGPGVFTLGGGFILGQPIDSDTFGKFDAGGGWAGLGYRFIIGD